MSATHALYLRWKAAKAFPSDRQAALALGLDPRAVTLWKNGRNGSLPVIERMANDMGEDYVPVIMQAFQETARDEPERKAWKRLANRLATGGALALVLGLPTPPAAAEGARDNAPGVYIMRSGKSTRRTRKRDLVTPGIFPDSQPVDGRPTCRTFPAWLRNEPTTLFDSRSTYERLRSRRVCVRSQRRGPSTRTLVRVAVSRQGTCLTRPRPHHARTIARPVVRGVTAKKAVAGG